TVQGEANLLEVVLALNASGGLAHFLHGGHQQADQDGDDGNHDEQLDQRKGGTPAHGSISGGIRYKRRGRNGSRGAAGWQSPNSARAVRGAADSPTGDGPWAHRLASGEGPSDQAQGSRGGGSSGGVERVIGWSSRLQRQP